MWPYELRSGYRHYSDGEIIGYVIGAVAAVLIMKFLPMLCPGMEKGTVRKIAGGVVLGIVLLCMLIDHTK